MILQVTEDTARVGIRILDWKNHRTLSDWRHVQLLIQPGQIDQPCHVPGGSPWYLHGCWPGKPVDVDVANPARADFPTICCDAFERSGEGAVVFCLPQRFKELPYGRYTGILQYHPHNLAPVNLRALRPEPADEMDKCIPPEYLVGNQNCAPDMGCHVPQVHTPPPVCCILSTFDIDYGPRCSEHIIDMAHVQFFLSTCGEEV